MPLIPVVIEQTSRSQPISAIVSTPQGRTEWPCTTHKQSPDYQRLVAPLTPCITHAKMFLKYFEKPKID